MFLNAIWPFSEVKLELFLNGVSFKSHLFKGWLFGIKKHSVSLNKVNSALCYSFMLVVFNTLKLKDISKCVHAYAHTWHNLCHKLCHWLYKTTLVMKTIHVNLILFCNQIQWKNWRCAHSGKKYLQRLSGKHLVWGQSPSYTRYWITDSLPRLQGTVHFLWGTFPVWGLH